MTKARAKTSAVSRIIIVVFSLCPLCLRGETNAVSPRAWTPELSMKVKTIASVVVSPDGSRVLYTVTDAVMTPERSEYVTQIYRANSDGGDVRQMTFADKSSTSPKWSRDGKWVAFLSDRSGKNNIYVMRADGGEASQITDRKTAVLTFDWSPDGKSLAFTTKAEPSDEEEKASKGKDDSRWIDENIKMNQLFAVDIARDASGKRIPRQLTESTTSVQSFDWSPDGAEIVFSHTRTPKPNDWPTADVSIINVTTREVRALATTQAAESNPQYSPDGKRIALVVSDLPPRWAQSGAIYLVSAKGGPAGKIGTGPDGQPNLIGWSGDGTKVFFSEARATGTGVYSIETDSKRLREVTSAGDVLSGVTTNPTGTFLGFVRQAPDRAPEAYITRLDTFSPLQVSRANEDFNNVPMGKTEIIRWKSFDGREIEGLLTYPVNYRTGARVPLLLNVHGGPAGVFNRSYPAGQRAVYPIETFAARGFAVLRVNPRGSSGYGVEFRRANFKDWGGGDYRDIMSGVDKVIEMGVADSERLGVMGWSYGGYMTSWIITQTNRFKAASVGAGVTNLMSFVGTADIPDFLPDYFGAQFWDDPTVYQSRSAMFNVKNASTPALIQHGENDERVPISQGYELYVALRMRGVPTRMIVFPRTPHGPNEPKIVLKAKQSNLDWFEKYLGQGVTAATR